MCVCVRGGVNWLDIGLLMPKSESFLGFHVHHVINTSDFLKDHKKPAT